jgi:fructose-1,6-bisphosphatase/inositol monophosphatase family enzyme
MHPFTTITCLALCLAGKPLFGTLISLLHNGVPVLGLIDQPVTRERWVGLSGQQSSLNGRPISVRGCGDIKNAYMYSTTPHMFAGEAEQVGGWWVAKWVWHWACVVCVQCAGRWLV